MHFTGDYRIPQLVDSYFTYAKAEKDSQLTV
jgi:hypothetical protein